MGNYRHPTPAEKQLINDRQLGMCALCRTALDFKIVSSWLAISVQYDHDLPRASGGSDHVSNYQAVHRACNYHKRKDPHATPIEYAENLTQRSRAIQTRYKDVPGGPPS